MVDTLHRHSFQPQNREEPSISLSTDASKAGWGCKLDGYSTGGLWTFEERSYHITYLETMAVYFGLKAYKNLCRINM